MRPPRVAILIFLAFACLIFLSRSLAYARTVYGSNPAYRSSGNKAYSKANKSVLSFMYYNTPFSLFPPNAAISLTDDNSTSFAARPAAFGPTLAARGLSGQLWVGSGFAEDHFSTVGELGCSDIPGWGDVVQIPAVNRISKGPAHGEHVTDQEQKADPSLTHAVARRRAPLLLRNNKGSNAADIEPIGGKIVLLTRGGCGFLEKVMWAQRRGARAVIVGDNQKGGPLIQMFAHGPEVDNVTIPSVFTARTTAQLLSSLAQPGSFIEETIDDKGKPVLKVHQRPPGKATAPGIRTREFSDEKRALAAHSFKRRVSSLFDRKRAPNSKFAWGTPVQGSVEKRENDDLAREKARSPKLFSTRNSAESIERDLDNENLPQRAEEDESPEYGDDEPAHEGLWVTITPTSSASPFFDTLLVLVISPLVTLTVVYAMLILRARIRRRRWRAPKSVVEQLPVRTYHTVAASSPSGTPRLPSPNSSSPTTPLLQASPAPTPSRSRTSTGLSESEGHLAPSSAIPTPASPARRTANQEREKGASGFSAEWKKYMGRQVECVVCLEEYVDGESQVMSLPCGHEFHAECITPWLTTRRRTCPICKGDVVRSLAHGSPSEPHYEPYHDDSDDESPIAEASGSGQDEREPDLEQGLLSQQPRSSRGWNQHDGGWFGIFANGFGTRARSPSPSGRDR